MRAPRVRPHPGTPESARGFSLEDSCQRSSPVAFPCHSCGISLSLRNLTLMEPARTRSTTLRLLKQVRSAEPVTRYWGAADGAPGNVKSKPPHRRLKRHVNVYRFFGVDVQGDLEPCPTGRPASIGVGPFHPALALAAYGSGALTLPAFERELLALVPEGRSASSVRRSSAAASCPGAGHASCRCETARRSTQGVIFQLPNPYTRTHTDAPSAISCCTSPCRCRCVRKANAVGCSR